MSSGELLPHFRGIRCFIAFSCRSTFAPGETQCEPTDLLETLVTRHLGAWVPHSYIEPKR